MDKIIKSFWIMEVSWLMIAIFNIFLYLADPNWVSMFFAGFMVGGIFVNFFNESHRRMLREFLNSTHIFASKAWSMADEFHQKAKAATEKLEKIQRLFNKVDGKKGRK